MTVADLLSIPTGRKEPFDLPLLLRRIDERTARNGATYFAVEFGDKTGSFSTNCFADNAATRVLTEAGAGAAVKAQGVTDHYNDRLSPRFTNVTVLDEEAAAPYWSQLLETAPEDADAMWAEFLASVEGIPHSGLRETVEKALDDMGERFREAPAGIMMHHAYRHGLLEHTLRMIRAANALLPLYPEVDPSLTLAGIALHDMGKCLEYSEGPAPQRTRTGIMQGHVVLGYRMARRAAMQAKLDPGMGSCCSCGNARSGLRLHDRQSRFAHGHGAAGGPSE